MQVVWATWDSFWQETSISGVSNAGKARSSLVRRLLWIWIFVAGVGFTAWSLSQVIQDYYTYPVVTTVTFENNDNGVGSRV